MSAAAIAVTEGRPASIARVHVAPGPNDQGRRQLLWRYFLSVRAGGRVLYGGPDPHALRGCGVRVDTLAGGWPIADGAGEAYDAVALEDVATLPVWSNRTADIVQTLCRVKRLLHADGELLMTFRRPTLRSPRTGRRAVSLRRLRRALAAAGFMDLLVLRMREELFGHELHRIDMYRPSLRSLVTGGALAVVARVAPRAHRSAGEEIVAGVTGMPVSAAELSAQLGSGAVHRLHAPACIVRMPQQEAAVPRCANNYSALGRLARLPLPFSVPKPAGVSEYNGLPCFAESLVPGRSIGGTRIAPDRRHRLRASATTALQALQRATMGSQTTLAEEYRRQWQQQAGRLLAGLDGPTARIFTEAMAALSESPAPVRTVFVHGDYKVTNMLWDQGDGLAGMVDWDLSCSAGLPVLDFLMYRAYDDWIVSGEPVAASMARQAISPEGDHHQFCLNELGLTAASYTGAGLLALVHYATHHAGILTAQRYREWCAQHVAPHLAGACGHFLSRCEP